MRERRTTASLLALGQIQWWDEPEGNLGKKEARKEAHGGLAVLAAAVKFVSLHENPFKDTHIELRGLGRGKDYCLKNKQVFENSQWSLKLLKPRIF